MFIEDHKIEATDDDSKGAEDLKIIKCERSMTES